MGLDPTDLAPRDLTESQMFFFNQMAGTLMVMPDFDAVLQQSAKVVLDYTFFGVMFYMAAIKDLPSGAW